MLILRFVLSLFTAGLLLAAALASGQTYPNKPIRMVTSGAGGGNERRAERPSVFSISTRSGRKFKDAFASDGIAQPIRPSRSTLLKILSRNGNPSR